MTFVELVYLDGDDLGVSQSVVSLRLCDQLALVFALFIKTASGLSEFSIL